MGILYILRGLPGSGKSTLAKKLSESLKIPHFEADMFHMVGDVYDWKPENVAQAHEWCQGMVKIAMMNGHDVIVSNTTTTEREIEPYLALAEAFEYDVVSLVVENRHGGLNQHNVPEETITKMRNRFTVKL